MLRKGKYMPRAALVISFFFVLSLAACSSAPAATPTQPELHTLEPSDTATAAIGCSVVNAQPTATAAALGLPAITGSDYTRGPAGAVATLLAYCDFQSATCQAYAQILDQLEAAHASDLRVVFRPVPAMNYIKQLDKTQISVQAALAAGDAGKFWEMRDRLTTKYSDWSALSVSQFKDWAAEQAAEIGMDAKSFQAAMESPEMAARAQASYDSAAQLNLSIPIAFVNGSLQGRTGLSYEGLDSTIGLISLGSRQFKTCPPFSIDASKQYTATLHTGNGNIVMQLFADKAPLAVNSFVFLARQGWFDGVTFHRVIPGFVAQAGDPSGTGTGGPGYYFANEIRTDLNFDKPGMVGMANSGPDTNGSQFFIAYAPQPALDGSYTVFAQVIQGMDVVESLTPRDPQITPGLPPGDKILSVTIEEK
jgi:cyclophilin family peptidyl-prolyl cis-trans isomerase